MGLDMYLTREIYIGANWEHNGIQGKIELSNDKGEPIVIKLDKVESIVEEVITWRKANAIHKFFVDHVQEGEDDCKRYYVDEAVLAKLVSYIEFVLKNPTKAPEVLPVQSGFFFGDTDYDDWYFRGLERTRETLVQALREQRGGIFYYQSSW